MASSPPSFMKKDAQTGPHSTALGTLIQRSRTGVGIPEKIPSVFLSKQSKGRRYYRSRMAVSDSDINILYRLDVTWMSSSLSSSFATH